MRKPSDFNYHPFSSVFQNTEHEIVARNVIVILKNTGDQWRNVTIQEYEEYRKKDGNYSISEKRYFEDVIPYLNSADKAELFSPSWKTQDYIVYKRNNGKAYVVEKHYYDNTHTVLAEVSNYLEAKTICHKHNNP